MKTAVLITDGIKQIMFTPENDDERQALKFISTEDEIETIIRRGSYSDDQLLGAEVYECQGGYYRARKSSDSIMFVLKPKSKKK